MPTKAMGVGVDSAITWFESNIDTDCPMFSVWNGNYILFSYTKLDAEAAKEHFENNINALISNGYNDVLILKSHLLPIKQRDNVLFVTNKTPVLSTFYWRPVELNRPSFDNSTSEYRLTDGKETVNSRMARLEEKFDILIGKINDEDDDEDEDDKETEAAQINGANSPANLFYGYLNNILSNQALQSAIVGKILNVLGTPQQMQPAIAGVNNNTQIKPMQNVTQEELEIVVKAISILKQLKPDVVNDLNTLAMIAQNDQQKANFILSMLPK